VSTKALLGILSLAIACASPAVADGPAIASAGPCCPPPACPPPCGLPPTAPGGTAPQTGAGQSPANQDANASQAPSTDAFGQAPPAGGEAAQSAVPNMIGDLPFYGDAPRSFSPVLSTVSTLKPVVTPGLTIAQINQQYSLVPTYPAPPTNTINTGIYVDTRTGQIYTAAQLNALTQPMTTIERVTSTVSSPPPNSLSNRVPVTSYGAFKISDNGEVAPTDRVFATYNYFDVDGFHGNSSSINREVIGFEKTFLDGQASFELRAPYTEVGTGLGGTSDIDALTMVFKYAAYYNRETGNVISTGLAVTVPTGPDIPIAYANTINPTLLQPYVGYAFNFGRFFLEGFSEIIVPTDNTLPTFIANDIGIGYRLESLPVIPTFEVHSNDALNHQGALASPIGFADSVILTGGVHFLFGKSDLTLGVTTPVTGPRLYGVEAIAELNWCF
jgi:hypothetical protein